MQIWAGLAEAAGSLPWFQVVGLGLGVELDMQAAEKYRVG